MNPYLSAMIGVVAGALCAGVTVDLKRDLDHANYVLSEKAQQDLVQKAWEDRISKAENAVLDARRAYDSLNADTQQLRLKFDAYKRNAKTTQEQTLARCADLAIRYREAVERAKPFIEGCRRMLE